MYVAELPPPGTANAVSLFVKLHNKEQAKPEDLVVSLFLWSQQGVVAVSVDSDRDNPLGRALTREEVNSSPLRALVFEISEFVGQNDPHVRPILDDRQPLKC
jgi:hypothetical protein